jgi:hypothetical protein
MRTISLGHEQRNVSRHAPHDCFYSAVQIKMHKNEECLPISNLNAALLGSPEKHFTSDPVPNERFCT